MTDQFSRRDDGTFSDNSGGGSGSSTYNNGTYHVPTIRLQNASYADQKAAGVNQWDDPAAAESKLFHKALTDQFSAGSSSYQNTGDNSGGDVLFIIVGTILALGFGFYVLLQIIENFGAILGFVFGFIVVPVAILAVILFIFVFPKTTGIALLCAFWFLNNYYGFSFKDLYYETRNAYFDSGSFVDKLKYRHEAASGDAKAMVYLAGRNLNRKEVSDFEREQAYSWIIGAVTATKDQIGNNGLSIGYSICHEFKDKLSSAGKIECLKTALESSTDPYAVAVLNFQLGEIHSKELAGEEDKSQGIYFYSKAANAGLKIAQKIVAQAYQTGSGVQRDKEKAAYWTARFNSNKCRREVAFCPQS